MSTESASNCPVERAGATWCSCECARASLHPRGLACESVITHYTRTQLGALSPRPHGSSRGIRTHRAGHAAAAAESSKRVRHARPHAGRRGAPEPPLHTLALTQRPSKTMSTTFSSASPRDQRASFLRMACRRVERSSPSMSSSAGSASPSWRLVEKERRQRGLADDRAAGGARDQPLKEESPILHCEVKE